MLNDLIRQCASELVPDWDAVASRLNDKKILVTKPKAGTKSVIEVIGLAEAEAVFTVFEATAAGRRGLQMLSDQSENGGLDFSNPITKTMIEQAPLSDQIKQKLISLGEEYKSPAESVGLGVVTADQCREAVENSQPTEYGAEVLISVNRNATGRTLVSVRRTLVGLNGGRVVSRDAAETITDAATVEALQTIAEGLTNGE